MILIAQGWGMSSTKCTICGKWHHATRLPTSSKTFTQPMSGNTMLPDTLLDFVSKELVRMVFDDDNIPRSQGTFLTTDQE